MTASAIDEGAVDAQNPWPGLPSFREIDAEFFHGRTLEIDELRRMVTRERVTVLLGGTGLGKTSLLQAGLFPAVRRDRLLPLRVRLDFGEKGSLAGQVRRALIRAAEASLLDVPEFREGESLWEMLHGRGRTIKNSVGQTVIPLVVFDQFEEIFTLGAAHADRSAFLEELACLVEDYAPVAVTRYLEERPERAADLDFQNSAYRLLLSLREDFMGELDGLRQMMPSVMQNRYHLCAFDRKKAREVVELPGAGLVDPMAVDEILEFVARRPARIQRPAGEGSVDPSILSVVCRELNNERRARKMPLVTGDLLKVVGDEILTALYTRALDRLPAADVTAARRFIEDRLVTSSGFRDSELQSDAEASVGQAVLKSLVDSRLLRLAQREENVWVELTHDVLLPVVTASRAARKEREAKIQAEAQRYALERQLRESSRRQKLALGAVVVMVGLLLAIGLLWGRGRRRQHTLDTVLTDTSLERARSVSPVGLMPQLAYLVRSRQDNEVARALLAGLLAYGNWPLPGKPYKQAAGITSIECSSLQHVCATGAEDGTVDIRNVRTGESRRLATLPGDYAWVNFSANERRLLVSSEQGHLEIWDTITWKRVGEPVKLQPPIDTSISQNGDYAVAANPDTGSIVVWRPGQEPTSFRPETHLTNLSAASSPTGYVAVGVSEGRLSLWKIGDAGVPESPLWTNTGPTGADINRGVTARVSNDGHALGVFDSHFLRVWDSSGKQIIDLAEESAIVDASLSPDGRWLVWATQKRGTQVRAVGPGPLTRTLEHEDVVRDLAVSRDSRQVVVRTQKGDVVMWDLATGEYLGQIAVGGLASYDWSGDHEIASASLDGRFQLWDVRPSAALPEVRVGPARLAVAARFLDDDTVEGVWTTAFGNCTELGEIVVRRWRRGASDDEVRPERARSSAPPIVSPDGSRLITVRCLGSASEGWTQVPSLRALWKPANEKTLSFPEDPPRINALTFSPDGKYLAAAANDGRVLVWDADRPDEPHQVIRNGSNARSVSLSAGALKIVSTSNLKMPRLFDAETKKDVEGMERLARDEFVGAATLSASGTKLLTAAGTSIRVWLVDGPVAVQSAWLLEEAPVSELGFGHSDHWLLTARDDRKVRLWDLDKGRTLGRPFPHGGTVDDAAISPDGKHVVTAAEDGLVRVWDVVIPEAGDSELLADLGEALAGKRWNAKYTTAERIPDDERFQQLERLKQRSQPGSHDTDGKRLVRWFLDDRSRRTISPSSTVTVEQARMQLNALDPAARTSICRALGGPANALAP